MIKNIILYFMLCTLAVLVQPEGLRAESFPAKVHLKIRSIRALGLLDEEGLRARKNIVVDTRLRDLDSELHALPFQMYQLLDQGVFPLAMKRKEDIKLATGQILRLRLLRETDNEVTLWLRWQDKGHGVLLDTRLQIEYGHTVMAGAESANKSGAVFAIEVLKIAQAQE